MTIILLVGFLLISLFGLTLLFGAPFLPTMKNQTASALDLLALKRGQILLELGCGDGRVLKAAAQRGIRGVGYEINPLLVLYARLHTWRYRQLVSIRWGNYWQAKWPPTDGIFVFLLDKYMVKLDNCITQKYKGKKVKLASVAFEIPHKKPQKTLHGVFLYAYE